MLYKELSAIFGYESGMDAEILPPVYSIDREDLMKTGVDLD